MQAPWERTQLVRFLHFFFVSLIIRSLQFFEGFTSPCIDTETSHSGPTHYGLPGHRNSHRGSNGRHPDKEVACQSSTQTSRQTGSQAGFHYVLGCECWLLAAAACVRISHCGRMRVDGLTARADAEKPSSVRMEWSERIHRGLSKHLGKIRTNTHAGS